MLNAVGNFDARQNAGALKEVAGFKTSAMSGVFSSPQGTSTSPAMAGFGLDGSSSALSEDELAIISDFEEESLRQGNFERIFPLQQNCLHYAKFFEYRRPSNHLLAKYLKCLPNGCSSITDILSSKNR